MGTPSDGSNRVNGATDAPFNERGIVMIPGGEFKEKSPEYVILLDERKYA